MEATEMEPTEEERDALSALADFVLGALSLFFALIFALAAFITAIVGLGWPRSTIGCGLVASALCYCGFRLCDKAIVRQDQ